MKNTPQTYMFFGRSGSGKGTQAELLKQKLEAAGRTILYIETGREFRAFIQEANHTAKLTKEALERGEFLPAYLPVWLWSERLVRNFDGTQDLILDGLARRTHEAPVLDSALKFYERQDCKILNVNVSREEATKRLTLRKRGDDVDEDAIKQRLDAYDREVLDIMDYFNDKKGYDLLDINGGQTIEEVHAEIMSKLGLS